MLLLGVFLISRPLWAATIEQGVRLFNQEEYKQAQQVFTTLANKGDAHATYWLGVVQYKSRQHFEAGGTFLKAAEMGNVWAMRILAGTHFNGNSPCHYLGWPCDKKWKNKTLAELERLAEAGDAKAIYALKFSRTDWWEYFWFYKYTKYREMYEATIPHGAYGLLDCSVGVCWESAEERFKYELMAAKQGYAPAMVSVYWWMNNIGEEEEANKWLDKSIKLGYPGGVKKLYFKYHPATYHLKKGRRLDVKKAYYYHELNVALGGDYDAPELLISEIQVDENGFLITDENDVPIHKILITEEEQAEIKQQVADFVKEHNIKPNLFLDETSIDLF